MKEQFQILLIVMFAFIAYRLYKKYLIKKDGKPDGLKKPDSSFGSSSKDDDYEPYSKKQ
jgi:hypothetical protein